MFAKCCGSSMFLAMKMQYPYINILPSRRFCSTELRHIFHYAAETPRHKLSCQKQCLFLASHLCFRSVQCESRMSEKKSRWRSTWFLSGCSRWDTTSWLLSDGKRLPVWLNSWPLLSSFTASNVVCLPLVFGVHYCLWYAPSAVLFSF